MKVLTHGLAKWADILAGIHLATSGVSAVCLSKRGMQLEYGIVPESRIPCGQHILYNYI